MTAATTWRTDEPCPVCGTGLDVLDDGGALIRAWCSLCGHADTWASTGNDTGSGQ